MNILSILQDENGQFSTTRVVMLLMALCLVTEWQHAIWAGVENWTPDVWKLSLLGGMSGMKLIQKPFEKKNSE